VEARPYRLLSETLLLQAQERVAEVLTRWAQHWGIAASSTSAEASRLSNQLAREMWPTPALAGNGVWLGMPQDFTARVYALLCEGSLGVAHAATKSVALGCAAMACEALAKELLQLPTGPAESLPHTLPSASVQAGHGLIAISMRIGSARLQLACVGSRLQTTRRVKENLPPLDGRAFGDALRVVRARCAVELGSSEVPLADLFQLKPGDVVVLDRAMDQPLLLRTPTGHVTLDAYLGRRADCYGVRVSGISN
jgi:hypothetical protein